MSTAASMTTAIEPPRLPEPARPESSVVGMVLFLFTEAMIFAALVSAFLVLQARAPMWPPPGQPRLPVGVTGVNTLLLIASGFTMLRADSRARAGRGAASWLRVTAVLGVLFLVVQGTEWARLLAFGMTGESGVYAATFYTMVGVHAAHVVAALAVLLVYLRRAVRAGRAGAGAAGPETWGGLRACTMYWVFVVAVWPVLYVLLYQPWKG